MFYDHPDLARAYLDGRRPDDPAAAVVPADVLALPRAVAAVHPTGRRVASACGSILRGKEAIFDWSDPLPFLLVHHLQIPWLLLGNLVRRKGFIRIDFNIGKLVEPAGD